MKKKELDKLENCREFLELKSPDAPFNAVRIFNIIFENLNDFLHLTKRAIRGGSIGDINSLKKAKALDEEYVWERLNKYGIDVLATPEVCNYYVSTFEAIRTWGLREIANKIKECLEEEEGVCKN